MTNLTFQDELKKDFQQLQELIIVKHEAYDNYCALKIAQKSVVRCNGDQASFENIMHCLEQLREYFMAIQLLSFLKVNIVTLNDAESKIYVSALNDRLLKLQNVISGGKEKKNLEHYKDEIRLIKIMLGDFEAIKENNL